MLVNDLSILSQGLGGVLSWPEFRALSPDEDTTPEAKSFEVFESDLVAKHEARYRRIVRFSPLANR
jgi:hypothetical protein